LKCCAGATLLKSLAGERFLRLAIANDERIVRHVGLLPPDTNSLYKLTRLSIPRFDELLESAVRRFEGRR